MQLQPTAQVHVACRCIGRRVVIMPTTWPVSALNNDVGATVAAIGGGPAGLMAAQTLAKSARPLVTFSLPTLLEASACGGGASALLKMNGHVSYCLVHLHFPGHRRHAELGTGTSHRRVWAMNLAVCDGDI